VFFHYFFFFFLSFLFFKIWLIIKLPPSTFPHYIATDLDKFPMQWLFMNTGLWLNFQMFSIHAIAAVAFLVLFYFLTRKKLVA